MQKYNAQLPKYKASSFFQNVIMAVENLWLFFNKLSIPVSSIGIEKTSMLNNKMLNAISMNKQGCPICGFADITVLDDFNCTTFEICECCGSESGAEFDLRSTPEHLAKIRLKWVKQDNCKWWGNKKLIPPNWNPKEQMELANIEIPQ